jgi:hypothetical protein
VLHLPGGGPHPPLQPSHRLRGRRYHRPAERIYSLSLGSQQANAHVHWHVAPLPPGVPYDQQEFSALREANGILDIPEADQAELARTIRGHL